MISTCVSSSAFGCRASFFLLMIFSFSAPLSSPLFFLFPLVPLWIRFRFPCLLFQFLLSLSWPFFSCYICGVREERGADAVALRARVCVRGREGGRLCLSACLPACLPGLRGFAKPSTASRERPLSFFRLSVPPDHFSAR